MATETNKHVRFYRLDWLVGWEPLDEGLMLYFRDGSRELIPMSAKDAEENSEFLCSEYPDPVYIRGIAWESLPQGRGELEKEWWDESDDVEDWQWPETRDDNTGEMRRVHRKYCLFALKDKNGRLARFLVCAAPGSNGTPSEDFSLNIEKKLILPYVENNPLTSELYESLTFKTLRWWSRNKANDQPRGEARKMRESDRDKKQLYKNLWNGFCNWCKQNAKRWYTVSLGPDHSTNSIHPSGGGNPHLFFKVANGQLYLGIYCTVSMYEEIQTRCAEEINAVYDDVDWTNGEDKKTWRSILIPINEDWRNPNEALFEKMSDAFERVGSILKRHGFNIKM